MSALGLKMDLQNQESAVEPNWRNTRQELARDEQRRQGLGRWWFASELCPLLAGTLGPLATGFTACSLTGDWVSITVRDKSGTHVQKQTNQSWVIVLNVICLCLGLISNGLSLILRWSLPAFVICAMGLSIQCFGLASLLIAVHFSMQKHEWPTKTKFTQAYYYAVFSSALSFTTLLSVVLHGLGVIWKYYTKQPRWSIVQRALLRQSIALTIYLLIGAVIFAETEDWAFLDAFFWADFTLLTIGLGGEFTPKKTLGRTLLLPYAIIGIFLVALLVISIQKLVRRGCLHVTNQLTIRYVKQLQKTLTTEGGAVYPMINKDIFNLIRRIETKAGKICSRIVLTVSIIAALVILLGGAAVFQIAEADQDWTYGVSCYFAYISLSTIGFGDYIPTSDAGKSFFVVWSLLAIPVLTVFINNSVDALYGTYRSLLLPFRRLFRGRRCQETKVQQSVGWAADIQDSIRPSAGKNNVLLEIGDTRVAQQAPVCIKQDELSGNSMNQSNAASRATLRLHCYLLAQELRNTVLEMNSESPKRYTYEEWRYYVHLLGRSTVLAEENHDRKGKSKVPVETQELLSIPPYMEAIEWVSQTSPLLSNSEPEWICLRLSSRLTELLSRMAAQD